MNESQAHPAQPDEPAPDREPERADAAAAGEATEQTQELPPPEPVVVPADEWAALQDAKAALEDRHLRLQAEFENYRKRVAKERLQARDGAVDEVTRSFLPVVDNFDRAVAAAEEVGLDEQLLAGWRLIHQQLYDVLRSFGVAPMVVVGQPFDPRFHDAVTEIPDDAHPAGHIAAEIERGYMVGDRVLRTARVAVSRGPDGTAEPADSQEG